MEGCPSQHPLIVSISDSISTAKDDPQLSAIKRHWAMRMSNEKLRDFLSGKVLPHQYPFYIVPKHMKKELLIVGIFYTSRPIECEACSIRLIFKSKNKLGMLIAANNYYCC
jgi:DNA-directed RNA polymerase subunit RPC12/RpoP